MLMILGGMPFSDAEWVPVLDLCELKCKPNLELCVENDDMKQRCNKCKFCRLNIKNNYFSTRTMC